MALITVGLCAASAHQNCSNTADFQFFKCRNRWGINQCRCRTCCLNKDVEFFWFFHHLGKIPHLWHQSEGQVYLDSGALEQVSGIRHEDEGTHGSCWLSERVAAISSPCCHCGNCCWLTDLHLSGLLTPTPQLGTTSKPRHHHLSSQLQLTYLTLPVCHRLHLPQSFPLQGFFYLLFFFLQPANPLIQSSPCFCCLSCVSFLCILSPGGPRWEAGDDSCISSRSWGHVGSAPLRHCRVCELQLHRGIKQGVYTSGKLWESRHSWTAYACVSYWLC